MSDPDSNTTCGSMTCEGWKRFSSNTLTKIAQAEAEGFTIVIGNDWQLDERPKWERHECKLLSRVNSRWHGWCVRTVWAVRPLPDSITAPKSDPRPDGWGQPSNILA